MGNKLVIPIWLLGVPTLLLAMYLVGSWWQESATGIPDAGPIIHLLSPTTEYLAAFAGISTLSYLLQIILFLPVEKKHQLSPVALRLKKRASTTSLIWFLVGLIAAQSLLVKILGISASRFFSFELFITYAWELSVVRALVLSALIALASALILRISKTINTIGFVSIIALIGATFSALTAHAAGVSGHALATTSGFFHVVGISIWLAGLIALYRHLSSPKVIFRKVAVERFGLIAAISVLFVVVSGIANTITRLDSISQFWTTNYGKVILLKITLTICALLIAQLIRTKLVTESTMAVKVLSLEISVLIFSLALASVAANTAFPKFSASASTLIEQLTGYPEPSELNWLAAFSTFTPDAFTLTVGLVAVGLYFKGVRTLQIRGDKWSIPKTFSWTAGVFVGVFVTNTEISRYALVSMSAHMTQHMALGMLIPILLVLGAPITLALRALRPAKYELMGPREWITTILQSNYSKLITHPLIALVLYSGSIFVVYFSSLMTFLMSSHLGHVLMHIHFVLSGYLFFWLIIGTDFQLRNIGYPFKLLLVLISMVIHAIFGLILMQSNSLVGGGWFGKVAPIWLTDPIADQQLAGSIAWSFGELPMLLVFIALGVQWAKADRQQAARLDRQADIYGDQERIAYNEMLNQLNKKSGKD